MRGRGVAAGYSLLGGETSALGWGDPRGGPSCPWTWLSLTSCLAVFIPSPRPWWGHRGQHRGPLCYKPRMTAFLGKVPRPRPGAMMVTGSHSIITAHIVVQPLSCIVPFNPHVTS